jgi:putative PIN family toxin of toxin-antitoxin system
VRLVVDTNVFVSAALKEASWPGELVRWLDGYDGLLKSVVTEAQVFEVLLRPYFVASVSHSFVDGVRRIFSTAEMVMITERIVACRDPTDDKFLEQAINGLADVLVTGDLDLLVLNPFRGLRSSRQGSSSMNSRETYESASCVVSDSV